MLPKSSAKFSRSHQRAAEGLVHPGASHGSLVSIHPHTLAIDVPYSTVVVKQAVSHRSVDNGDRSHAPLLAPADDPWSASSLCEHRRPVVLIASTLGYYRWPEPAINAPSNPHKPHDNHEDDKPRIAAILPIWRRHRRHAGRFWRGQCTGSLLCRL